MQERTALIYGLQRSATNYFQQLILKNYGHIRFLNDSYARCLPTHKHFRLYDEKAAICNEKYLNTFLYEDFGAFKSHVASLTGEACGIFLVCVKHPFSWYLSYGRHARKNGLSFFRKSTNSHYIIDYNLFYGKWMEFARQSPSEVMFLKYEDFIRDLPLALDQVEVCFRLEKSRETLENPVRVPMNKRFTHARKDFYNEERFLREIRPADRKVILDLLDGELLGDLGYALR
jgi:hypothetical protein